MSKLNNKGFMMAELLIVTVAILIIFMAIYQNYYPTLGEYENRMSYNNIDTEYATFYTRVLYLNEFKDSNIESEFFSNYSSNTNYLTLINKNKCNTYNFSSNFISKCNTFAKEYGIDTAIITNYNTNSIKKVSSEITDLTKYINYIPKYSSSNSSELYRLIVKTKTGYSNVQFYSEECKENYIYTFYNIDPTKTYESLSSIVVKYSNVSTTDCSSSNINNTKCEKMYCTDNCTYGSSNQSMWNSTDCSSDTNCKVGYRIMTIQDNNTCPNNEICSSISSQNTPIAYRYKSYSNINNFSVSPCNGGN